MSLHHDWGWQQTQTASPIHIRYTASDWAYLCAVHGHMAVASNSYTHTTWVRFWGSGSVVESNWCHYIMVEAHSQLKPQTASHIHSKCIQSVWAYWYAVHGHMALASNRYNHTTRVRFWGSGSLVESKWCHYIMVEADSQLKLLPASTVNICKVFEHIDMLSMGIWH